MNDIGMEEKVNLVTIEHLTRAKDSYGSSGHFTFRVPAPYKLKIGTYVLVDTARGKDQVGICVCDSFYADPEVAFPLLGIQPKKLKTIKAVLNAMPLIDAIVAGTTEE